ncbi:MAG: DNA polymerase, partial [Patescibacteria group bacterium]
FGFFGLLKRLDQPQDAVQPEGEQALLFSSNVSSEERITAITALSTAKEFSAFISLDAGGRFACAVEGKALFLVNAKTSAVSKVLENLFHEASVKTFFQDNHFVCHDAKSAIHFLRRFGIEMGSCDFDTMIASYLTGAFSRDFSYAGVVGRALGRPAHSDIAQEFVHIFEITSLLQKKLEAEHMQTIFLDTELPIIRILADMEEEGVMVDPVFLKKLAKKIDGELITLTAAIYREAGEEFNINSPRQLSHILFDVLELATAGLRKTAKGGVVSTGAAELEKLKTAHPIVLKILLYRELIKLKGTYVDVLPTLVNASDCRIHTTFNQTTASTGRLSSSNPNLQHIPISKTNPMSAYGREIRKSFIAPKGFLLCSFDYSQIELRVAAHMADDKKMIEAFQKGLDIHSMTAASIYHIPLEKVTSELRRAAKTLNFGILYGMGAMALAESTDMSREQAKKFIDDYFREFAGVKKYLESTKRFAETHGYVETLFGRRRYIPEINSPNWQVKREAERMATN